MKLKRSKRDDINKSNIISSKRNRVTSTDGILSLISCNKIPGIFYSREEEEEMKQHRKQTNTKFPKKRKVIAKKDPKSDNEIPKRMNGMRKKTSSVLHHKKIQKKETIRKARKKFPQLEVVITKKPEKKEKKEKLGRKIKIEKKEKIEKQEKRKKQQKQQQKEKPTRSSKSFISEKNKGISIVPQNNIISRPPIPFQEERSENYQNLKERDQRMIAGEKNCWVAKKIKNFISFQNHESSSFKILQEHIGKVNNEKKMEETANENKMVEQPRIVIKIEDD